MNIVTAFDINLTTHELVCFVGAGGKTTIMFKLARELKGLNKRVLVTTTTNIYLPRKNDCDRIISHQSPDVGMLGETTEGTIIVLGAGITSENKLAGLNKEFIEGVHNCKLFDYILVECDGAKHKPIKAPAAYEPVVPDNATKAIGVIGLDAVGNPITEDYVHRLEQFCDVVQRRPGEMIDEEAVVELIVSAQGLFKGVPEKCKKYVVLNKAEDSRRKASAGNILISLLQRDSIPVTKCVIASMARNRIYP